jgi:hypothetical protein
MHIEVRFVEGCANLPLLRDRLARALDAAGWADVDVRLRPVVSAAEAEALGFTGSPTLLIDGIDPFADGDAAVGLSCRLYRTRDGASGAPTVHQLTAALINVDLEHARSEFHRLLDSAASDDWDKPTRGTRWTNEQLLFHMVFGYMVVQRLLLLARVFGRLPDRVSAIFARMLNAATTPFHPINYYGSCAAARVFNRRRMGSKLDRVIDSLQRRLARESDDDFRRGMHYPTRWDPFFRDYMTLQDVYLYPGRHFDFHARQLTLADTA